MNIPDAGVLSGSFMDFVNESDFARRALYYAPRFGHFICDSRYAVTRDSLDLYLLFFVCGGMLRIESQGRTSTVEKDQIALLDCHHPHTYRCAGHVDFLWIHFSGCSSAEYAKLLYDQSGIVFTGSAIPALRARFDLIIENSQSAFRDEHFISVNLHQILSRLAAPDAHVVGTSGVLRPAIDFISENYSADIDLGKLASVCNLSTSHLIRCFKRFARCTPHEYLLSYRLRQSKQLLLTTALSVDQIAERCGFNSASHFARAFRNENAISPSEFRGIRY